MTDYYKEKLQEGLEYQDFVTKYFSLCCYSSKKWQNEQGENTLNMEIKYDKVLDKTGNVYIETHEKTNADNAKFVESGCLRTNSWLYLIGNYTFAYVFSTKQLKNMYEKHVFTEKEIGTSKGFLINSEDAHKYSINEVLF
jgi:hypothetical protein